MMEGKTMPVESGAELWVWNKVKWGHERRYVVR